jgi:hypothetical protein
MASPCGQCPAAFLIAGADRRTQAVLCRVDSTTRGERSEHAGPVSLVRAATSPAAYYGYCCGDLQAVVRLVDELGAALATPVELDIADRARNSGAQIPYSECPSWRAEKRNRAAAKLVDQRGERRVHALT